MVYYRKTPNAQKLRTLEAFIGLRQKLDFSPDVIEGQQAGLKEWFLGELLDILTAQPQARRNPASEWLHGDLHIMLHPDTPPPGGKCVDIRDNAPAVLHIYRHGAPFTQQLCDLLEQVRQSEPQKRELPIDEAEALASNDKDGNLKPPTRLKKRRNLYDPTASDLSLHDVRHTAGDLRIYGVMRTGKTDYDGVDTARFEDVSGMSQNLYEKVLEKGGSRWLWDKLHEYLLSDEALKSKTPGRWFRDMCVLCGVSTNTLKDLTSIGQHAWTHLQNEKSRDHMRYRLKIALQTTLDEPRLAPTGGHMIPAGSLFGLPTEKKHTPGGIKEIVNADVIRSIEKALFGSCELMPEKELLHLHRVSQAYQQGAIGTSELLDRQYVRQHMHTVVRPYGYDRLYAKDSPECQTIFSLFHFSSRDVIGIKYFCDTIRHINDTDWHMPKDTIETMLTSLTLLPGSKLNLFDNGTSSPASVRWEYAKKHHEGTVGGLLTAYRMASHATQEALANKDGTTKENISQLERGARNPAATVAYALSQHPETRKPLLVDGKLKNVWDLPTDDAGNIRKDVALYMMRFKQHPPLPAASTHWLTAREAMEEVGGLETPTERFQDKLSRPRLPYKPIPDDPALVRVRTTLQTASDYFPQDAFPLITLPDKTEILVRRGKNGEAMLLDSELPLWRGWLLSEMHKKPERQR